MNNYGRLYAIALKRAKDAAGGERAFGIVGPVYRRALVAEEILTIVDQQDESTSDTTVRAVLSNLRDLLTSDEGLL